MQNPNASKLGADLANRFAVWLSYPALQDSWLANTKITDLAEAYSIATAALVDLESDPDPVFNLVGQSLRDMRDRYLAEAIRRGNFLHEGNNSVATVAGISMAAEIRSRLSKELTQ